MHDYDDPIRSRQEADTETETIASLACDVHRTIAERDRFRNERDKLRFSLEKVAQECDAARADVDDLKIDLAQTFDSVNTLRRTHAREIAAGNADSARLDKLEAVIDEAGVVQFERIPGSESLRDMIDGLSAPAPSPARTPEGFRVLVNGERVIDGDHYSLTGHGNTVRATYSIGEIVCHTATPGFWFRKLDGSAHARSTPNSRR